MKRLFCILLCVVMMLVSLSPVTVFANSFETAQEMSLGEVADAEVARTDDTTKNYWTSFRCEKTEYYTITVRCSSLRDNMVVEVYDAGKKLIESSVNNTGAQEFGYTFFLTEGNTYFFKYFIYDGTADISVSINAHTHSFTKFDLAPSIADDDAERRLDGFARFTCPECKSSYYAYIIPAPASVKLSGSTVYTGAELTPVVTVYDYTGKLIPQSEYYLAYEKNMNTGKAFVTVTFTGELYQGELTKSFIIKPKKQNLSSLKSTKSKQMSVVWKKDTTVSGYELLYSTSSKFSKSKTKTVTITKNSTTSKTIKALTANKKYYVKLRAYKTVDGVKQYGSYSAVKSVKIKK